MSNQITWLHISDIHFHKKTEWNAGATRSALLGYLKSVFADGDVSFPDIIFCTGDIAYGETNSSTLAEQYEIAKVFFDELREICSPNGKVLSKERLFVVPGNHDINRSNVNKDAQESLTRMAEQSRKHVDEINQRFAHPNLELKAAMSRLNEYNNFISNFLPSLHDDLERCFYTRSLKIGDIVLGIAGFNSAWSSSGAEDDRHLWLGSQWQFNKAESALGQADVRIGLIHHPADWLNEAERDIVARRAPDNFDFWLHGHSHNAWVTPSSNLVTIAAGAVGAHSSEEFGINLTTLDFTQNKGIVSLHSFSPRDNGWTIQPIPKKAPKGMWKIEFPMELKNRVKKLNITRATHLHTDIKSTRVSSANRSSQKLFGRKELLKKASSSLLDKSTILIYGLRGNGKSSVIDALLSSEPLNGKKFTRFSVMASTTAGDVFRHLAPFLGDTSESPIPPEGTIEEICDALTSYSPSIQPTCIWVDRAHQLVSGGEFRDNKLKNLLLALQKVTRKNWTWLFELREKPPSQLFGDGAVECEVPGLDRRSLGEFLLNEAPIETKVDWDYKGNELQRIYQWLGGGHGNQAHPLATRLMIELALGLNLTPMEILLRHIGDFELKVEEALLHDLFSNVLSKHEQMMLEVLCLYRKSIPHDHIDLLEDSLKIEGAFSGLERRFLISGGSSSERYYLHGFVTMWIRHKFGFKCSDNEDPDFTEIATKEEYKAVIKLQSAIADCWLSQLRSRRLSPLNIERALEAFYHLTEAGKVGEIHRISVELLGGNLGWAKKRIEIFNHNLFNKNAPIDDQIKGLEYGIVLDPDDHKALRFLGECYTKKNGPKSDDALACFEKACDLEPGFSPYLANLGKALFSKGKEGAYRFIQRVGLLEKDCPSAISEHVKSIECNCLDLVGEYEKASDIRRKYISLKTINPAFYVDEAKSRYDKGDSEEALKILDLAKENNCENDYIIAVRSRIIGNKGTEDEARKIRLQKIREGSKNSAFYADEAQYLLNKRNSKEALKVLDLAINNGCENDFIISIKTTALEEDGDIQSAQELRMKRIMAGSTNSVFYNKAAITLIDSGAPEEAIRILDLGKSLNATDAYTLNIRQSALSKIG
ncbi:metallophosphoesterase [Rheinheimera aquimaris]|uniref:metallophosphoesterase n=1 Tax=Rheinheimera aquimaris TaxID=412437 RepID=UPI001E646BAF|nr:metallophosphoesterase [Rheinheimera aquimaris]MCD1597821.1 metallophosphoesterase [Rheinheimera aquimaris]